MLTWLQDNLGRDLTLADIATQAGTSTRTLIRRFREQAGTTPLQWLHRARVRQAQHLLETTQHSVERIGAQVGFGSPTAFRDRFKRTTGVSPHAYRHYATQRVALGAGVSARIASSSPRRRRRSL